MQDLQNFESAVVSSLVRETMKLSPEPNFVYIDNTPAPEVPLFWKSVPEIMYTLFFCFFLDIDYKISKRLFGLWSIPLSSMTIPIISFSILLGFQIQYYLPYNTYIFFFFFLFKCPTP